MTVPQPPPTAAAVRSAYDQTEAAVTSLAGEDSLAAYNAARDLLEQLELLVARARDLRDRMVLQVRDDRQLSLAKLTDVLRWGVSRPRMQQIIDRARDAAAADQTQPPAA